MIDVDSEASKRLEIVSKLKEKYGHDRVLNFGTFGTEASKSIVMTTCKGLGIDKEEAKIIKDMIPTIRGENYTISQMLFGDEEKDIKPNKAFINLVDSYEGLRQALLKNEGMVKSRSCHASGEK